MTKNEFIKKWNSVFGCRDEELEIDREMFEDLGEVIEDATTTPRSK